MVCIMIFFYYSNKNKNIFVLGVPKVLCGGKTKCFDFFFFVGASVIKSWEKSRIFRYDLPDFLSRGQKTTGGVRRTAPLPPHG